jgi:hypothetical protein
MLNKLEYRLLVFDTMINRYHKVWLYTITKLGKKFKIGSQVTETREFQVLNWSKI